MKAFKFEYILPLSVYLGLFMLLAGCTSATPVSDRQGLAADCERKKFASVFAAYREASDDAALWQQAECHLGVPASIEEAYALQAAYVQEREKKRKAVGYKVALGSNAAQQLLGAPEPVHGVLFDNMLVASASTLSRHGAQRVAVEADLLVTVKSAAINEATTVEQVAEQIESISAYIEIPDLMLPLRNDMATRFVATNAAAFKGVVGDTVKTSNSDNRLSELASMQVELRDGEGAVLSSRSGRSLMGHPYNAVLFLLNKLRLEGTQLQAGDVLSLGAYSKPIPVDTLSRRALKKISVYYQGLFDQKNNKSIKAEVFF